MARQDALSIYINDNDKDKLAETYGEVIEAVQKGAVSEQIKNKNYSGDPTTGSVEIDRFANASIKDKGTARTNAEGDKLKDNGKVTINVDTDKEIVEEIAKKDIKLFGITGMAEKRKNNHIKKLQAYLDTEFFACAVSEGTNVAGLTSGTIVEKLEALIQSVETTQNDWVDGVDREPLFIEYASQKNSSYKIEYIVGDCYNIPAEENTFDCCYARYLFQHLKYPLRALSEIKRVVKPHGVIGIHDFDYDLLITDNYMPLRKDSFDLVQSAIYIINSFISKLVNQIQYFP